MAAAVIFTCVCVILSLRIDLNPSLDTRFLGDNKHLASYKKIEGTFGMEPLFFVVWETKGGVFNPRAFSRLTELCLKLEKIDGVKSVISAASVASFAKDKRAVDLDLIKSLPAVRKLFAGASDTKSIIAVVPKAQALSPSGGLKLMKDLEAGIASFERPGEKGVVTGPLAMQSKALEYSRKDLLRALAIICIAVIAVFGFLYRGWQAIFCAGLVCVASVAGAVGVVALFAHNLSQFALIAIPVLAVISLEDVVHLLENFKSALKSGKDPDHAIKQMISDCKVPCLGTSITTIVGFASLMISKIEQVRSIGLIVVVGSVIAYALAMVLVPSLIRSFPFSIKVQTSECKRFRTISRMLHKPRAVLLAVVALTIFACVGILHAHISLDFPKIFRDYVPIQRQFLEMDKELGGSASFEIMASATDGSNFLDPKKIESIYGLQVALGLMGPVKSTVSPVDIGLSAYLLNGTGEKLRPDEKDKKIEDAVRMTSQMDPSQRSMLHGFVTPDFKNVRIHVRLIANNQKYYDQMEQALANLQTGFRQRGILLTWSGFSLLYKEVEKRMLHDLLLSFGASFIGVVISMILIFRSLKWGFLSMIPNILPIAMTVGLMGWCGVGFSLGLIILPAVGLGLIVNDTIHIIMGIRRGLVTGEKCPSAVLPTTSQSSCTTQVHSGCSFAGALHLDIFDRSLQGPITSDFQFNQRCNLYEAIGKTLATSGNAMIVSTMLLMLGFVSLAASPFTSNVHLSIFMPLLLLLALLFDLVCTPLIFVLLARK